MCSLISVYEAWESRQALVCTVLLGKQQQLTVSDLPQGLLQWSRKPCQFPKTHAVAGFAL